MAITGPVTSIPTEIKSVTITLKRWIADENNNAGESVNYQIWLLDQDGNRIRWPHDAGNLVPYLTPTQITQLQAFMDAMWILSEGVLPE